jgi:hypothetical protein
VEWVWLSPSSIMALLLLTLPIRSPLPALPGFLEHRGANPMLGGRPEGPRSGAGSGPGPGGHRGPTGARAHLANPLAGEPHRLFCTSTDSLKQAEAFRSHRRAICAYAKSVGFQDTGYGIVTTRLCAGRNGETPWAGLCRLLAPPLPMAILGFSGGSSRPRSPPGSRRHCGSRRPRRGAHRPCSGRPCGRFCLP